MFEELEKAGAEMKNLVFNQPSATILGRKHTPNQK